MPPDTSLERTDRKRCAAQPQRLDALFSVKCFSGELEELIAVEVLIVLEHALDGMQRRAHHRNHGLIGFLPAARSWS